MKLLIVLAFCAVVCLNGCTTDNKKSSENRKLEVRGWNILSDDIDKGLYAIESAEKYQINHLQLSHQLIMDLKDVRNPKKLETTRRLIKSAHDNGVNKVFVWDHALYNLKYYPDRFKTTDGLIDLDKPEFWNWLKNDYRSMLDSLPKLDGIILTFIETGAHVEDQYSVKWKTEKDKLANMVDSLASVIIDERGLEMYIRTFIYHKAELDALIGCVNTVKHPDVKVMTKEVPHDFFLTHPISDFISKINKDVLIEFDLGHEYNGQGVIASILPEITVERWKYYSKKDNVIGYVARTDRYNDTQNIGRSTEMNIYALNRISEDPDMAVETIVEEFVTEKYGESSAQILKNVFLKTDDIITSSLYTLGLHMNWHSSINYENENNYSRHCSGKWMDNPEVMIKHGVNKSFHYWKDIINHLSPARYKSKETSPGKASNLFIEAPWIINDGWVSPDEKMNLEYLKYILIEKEYGVNMAKWALEEIRSLENKIADQNDFNELLQLYERTYLTAQLYLATSKVYFGFRAYLNDDKNAVINEIISDGLNNIDPICERILDYKFKGPKGQYHWLYDVHNAKTLSSRVLGGWDVYGNVKFKKSVGE